MPDSSCTGPVLPANTTELTGAVLLPHPPGNAAENRSHARRCNYNDVIMTLNTPRMQEKIAFVRVRPVGVTTAVDPADHRPGHDTPTTTGADTPATDVR